MFLIFLEQIGEKEGLWTSDGAFYVGKFVITRDSGKNKKIDFDNYNRRDN